MAEEQENMAKVKVHRQVTIVPNQTSTVVYPAGFEGTAPHDHIKQIVEGGHGEHLEGGPSAPQKEKPAK